MRKKKIIWQVLCPDCGAVMAEHTDHREIIGKTYICDGPHDEELRFVGRQQHLMRKRNVGGKKFYEKLIRDNVPEIMDGNNVEYSTRIVTSNKEIKFMLNNKLIEEAQEFINSPSLGEFADILEVLDALKKFHHYKNEEIKACKELKHSTHGGFDERIVLEWTRENEEED